MDGRDKTKRVGGGTGGAKGEKGRTQGGTLLR